MSFAAERVDLLPRLRKLAAGRALVDAFLLDQRTLRFHLGTSLADLRVPVAVDGSLQAAFAQAALDLHFLLCVRHRAALREGDYDQLLLLDGFDPKAPRPVCFGAPAQVTREGVRHAFVEGPELHPALDSGLLATWISHGRPGRVLVSALNALFRRAIAEGDGKEPTAYLALLALRGLAEQTMGALKQAPLGAPMGRAISGAVAMGLLVAARLAAREAGVGEAPGGLTAQAALSPLPWLASGRQVPGSFSTAWGATFFEPPQHLDLLAQRIIGGAPLDQIARDVQATVAANKEAGLRAERSGALFVVRSALLAVLRATEVGRAPPFSLEGMTLPHLYSTPGALGRLLKNADRRKDLVARAKNAARGCTSEHPRAQLEIIAAAAKDWREEDPAWSWLGVPEAHQAWVASACALAVDVALDRLCAQAERQVLHRDGHESEGGLEQEHGGGKLYLFAFDEVPILHVRPAAAQMAHLFCDVKDFTRRTAFLKETVVADFLSREFYEPILTAAARYHHGATHLGDKGGIYLNNLLGDAVSLSGDVVALVDLSHDVQAALQSYGARLDSEGSREAVGRAIAAIEERCAVRKAKLDASLARASAAQQRGTLDLESGEEPGTRMRALAQELGRLADERESELALVLGEKLEAGIFISYGAAPEVATFEDAVFGQQKVSIAEKINESARGTARNGGVRARIDSLLEQARRSRGKADLSCPFQVFISQPLSIPISSDLEGAVRGCLDAGDAEGAETVLGEAVRGFLARLSSQDGGAQGGDIYNGGIAVSEEALRAYMAARASDLLFVQREVPVAALHASLRERFVFPMQTLQLVVGVSQAGRTLRELYAFVGRALFKGFEKTGGLGVYELCAPQSTFATLIGQHHLPAWLRQHDRGSREEEDLHLTPALGVLPLKTGNDA